MGISCELVREDGCVLWGRAISEQRVGNKVFRVAIFSAMFERHVLIFRDRNHRAKGRQHVHQLIRA